MSPQDMDRTCEGDEKIDEGEQLGRKTFCSYVVQIILQKNTSELILSFEQKKKVLLLKFKFDILSSDVPS